MQLDKSNRSCIRATGANKSSLGSIRAAGAECMSRMCLDEGCGDWNTRLSLGHRTADHSTAHTWAATLHIICIYNLLSILSIIQSVSHSTED